MYSESLSSPICHSQSILIKETPAADNYIIQTKERSVYWHKYKRKWCHSKWHDYYIVHFCICQPLFWNFFKFFHRKRQPRFTELSPLKSLAFHRHRFLPISFVRNCKRTITAYFILSYIYSSVKSKDSRILTASWYIYSFYDRSGLREWLGQSQTIALTIYIV